MRPRALLMLSACLVVAACAAPATTGSGGASPASATTASGAPASSNAAASCDPARSVVPQTEGPYYSPDPPERADITEPGTVGTPMTLTGRVLDASCRPVAGARVDFWQADGRGEYDNSGYRLRGYQVTDAEGRYALTTVVPGIYPGRTEHIHVKVTPPGGQTITSQLYFPAVAENERDRFFQEAMLITVVTEPGDRMDATFDLVLP